MLEFHEESSWVGQRKMANILKAKREVLVARNCTGMLIVFLEMCESCQIHLNMRHRDGPYTSNGWGI